MKPAFDAGVDAAAVERQPHGDLSSSWLLSHDVTPPSPTDVKVPGLTVDAPEK